MSGKPNRYCITAEGHLEIFWSFTLDDNQARSMPHTDQQIQGLDLTPSRRHRHVRRGDACVAAVSNWVLK